MQIKFDHVTYVYNPNSPSQLEVLKDISFTINQGEYVAIVGHTGSGKSTLAMHFNGLKKPTKGTVFIDSQKVTSGTKNKELRSLHQKVGLVFQLPETQLFETTVLKDISFGPMNYGVSEADSENIAYEMLEVVGLDRSIANKSPFDLSGGQQRRVAIAGVLAMKPDVIILDEPTAGLDPIGSSEMLALFKKMQDDGKTIISVTHQMDDVAQYADRVLLMDDGRLEFDGSPTDLFQDVKWLAKHHLDLPKPGNFAEKLQQKGKFKFSKLPITLDDLVDKIKDQIND